MDIVKTKKGFTLIELLVVVSIVGILATIIISSLSGARDKSHDAKIKNLMNQMRTHAELFNSSYGSYRGSDINGWRNDDPGECTNSSNNATGSIFDPNLNPIFTELILEIDSIASPYSFQRVFCGVAGINGDDSWAFAAPLRAPQAGTTGWCVDSSGNSRPFAFGFGPGDSSSSLQIGSEGTFFSCP